MGAFPFFVSDLGLYALSLDDPEGDAYIVMSPRLPRRRQCRPIVNELRIIIDQTSTLRIATFDAPPSGIVAVHAHLHDHTHPPQTPHKFASLPAVCPLCPKNIAIKTDNSFFHKYFSINSDRNRNRNRNRDQTECRCTIGPSGHAAAKRLTV